MSDNTVKQTRSEWIRSVIERMPYDMMSDRYNFSEFALKLVLNSAIDFGMSLTPPPFPPDSEKIQRQTREIERLEAMIELAGTILADKDQQIQQMKGFRTSKNDEIDRLLAVIERQKGRIKALESDPTHEEARFNIERQYEREFTNSSHLMAQIADLNTEISIKNRKIESLEQGDEVLKATATRIAEQVWQGYTPREEKDGSTYHPGY